MQTIVSAVCVASLMLAVTQAATVSLDSSRQSIGNQVPGASLARLLNDVLGRATSTSEVLTLNITNLIILFVIKAIIIAGGMFLFGGGGLNLFSGGASGRSDVGESWMDNDDMLMMLTYLLGSGSKDFDCLNRVACEKPDKARQYVTAAKLMLSVANFADGIISVDRNYEKLVREMQQAIHHGQKGGVCSLRYTCQA